jgi:hypothetical protein
VKHLHHEAKAFDIGIYFEANGHGTVLFKPSLLQRLQDMDEQVGGWVSVGVCLVGDKGAQATSIGRLAQTHKGFRILAACVVLQLLQDMGEQAIVGKALRHGVPHHQTLLITACKHCALPFPCCWPPFLSRCRCCSCWQSVA